MEKDIADGGGDGGGRVSYAENIGTGGIVPGTRAFWPMLGSRNYLKQLSTTLAAHPLAIIAGPNGSGRSSLINQYITAMRVASKAPATITGKSTAKPVGAISAGEYNVVVWLDASSHATIQRTFYDLFAYLRLHSMKFDTESVLAGVHAWMHKQDRWLLVFDNCRLPKSELLQYAPSKGGHSIVVLKTTTHDSGTGISQQGFDLSAQDVLRLNGLPSSAATKAFTFVSGTFGVQPARRREFAQLFQNHTGALLTAGMLLMRCQTTMGLSEVHTEIEGRMGAVKEGEKRKEIAVDAIIDVVGREIIRRLHAHVPAGDQAQSHRVLRVFLNLLSVLPHVIPHGSNVIAKEVLLALLSPQSTNDLSLLQKRFSVAQAGDTAPKAPLISEQQLQSEIRLVLRELSNFGLVSEHAVEFVRP